MNSSNPLALSDRLESLGKHGEMPDATVEFECFRDRLSWLRFLGLDLGSATPEENTIRHFRNRLTGTGWAHAATDLVR